MTRTGAVTQVPDLVGRSVSEAHDAALDAGVLPVDEPPVADRSSVVVRQQPGAGCSVVTGARVRLWTGTDPDDRGGGRGGRRPLGPRPLLPAGTK